MSTRPRSTTRHRTHRTRREISAKDVKEKLRQFNDLIFNFSRNFDLKAVYDGVKKGNESVEAFEKTREYKNIKEFTKKYTKQEIKKLTKIKEKHEIEIHDISNNEDLSTQHRNEKLNKMKTHYNNSIQQINEALKFKPYDNFEDFTFEQYYHIEHNFDAYKKKDNDIKEFQEQLEELKFELQEEIIEVKREKLEQKIKEKETEIFEQYQILNNINLQLELYSLLGDAYYEITSYKWTIYTNLISVIDNELHFLTRSSRSSSVQGKKKTKKRLYRRKIIKSKHKKN
jgi:hypothetical protein